jgi:hypothetical protein
MERLPQRRRRCLITETKNPGGMPAVARSARAEAFGYLCPVPGSHYLARGRKETVVKQELIHFDAARKAIQKAACAGEAKGIRDKAEALRRINAPKSSFAQSVVRARFFPKWKKTRADGGVSGFIVKPQRDSRILASIRCNPIAGRRWRVYRRQSLIRFLPKRKLKARNSPLFRFCALPTIWTGNPELCAKPAGRIRSFPSSPLPPKHSSLPSLSIRHGIGLDAALKN